jgi:hypothetical protein
VSSPVREALEHYVAGRLKAERLVIAVAAAYYGEREPGGESREQLQPLIDVIDRASPGIVELGGVEATPGFELRLGERPFPKQYEAELRRAAEACLASERTTGVLDVGPAPNPGLFARVAHAIRRFLTASA